MTEIKQLFVTKSFFPNCHGMVDTQSHNDDKLSIQERRLDFKWFFRGNFLSMQVL